MMVALVLVRTAAAQGPLDAALRGRLVDARGVAVAGVHLRAVAAASGSQREVVVDGDGRFFLLRLEPQAYRLCVGSGMGAELSLAAGELSDVELVLEADGSVRLHEVGPVSGPGRVGDAALRDLPVRDGEWEALGELDSQSHGATPATRADEDVLSGGEADDGSAGRDAIDAGSAATGLSLGGLAPIHNESTVDGLNLQQSFRAGPRGAAGDGARGGSRYAAGAVRSLRLTSREFSAQYGAAGGGWNVATRSGEGGLHGSAFLLAAESAWAAANPFSVATHYANGLVSSNVVKPDGRSFHFGGSLGRSLGLVRKVGLFGSLEVQRRQGSLVSTPASTSFFSLTPMQTTLLGTRGVSATATNAALTYLDGLTGTIAADATRVLGFVRMDAAVTKSDAVMLSFSGHASSAPAGAALGQASDAVVASGRGSVGGSYVEVEAGAGRWLHTFSPRWNLETRAQVAHELAYETPHAPLPQEPGIGPDGLAPQVTIAPDGFSYGTPTSLGRSAYPDELRVELAEAMQVRMGRTLVTVGGSWSRVHDRIASLADADGAFLYDSGTTGGHDGGLVDWITDTTFNVNAYPNGGCPNIHAAVHDFCFRTYTQSFGTQQTEFVTQEFAGFAEAALRLRRDLSITVGTRYDYTLLPLPQVSNPTLDADLTALGLANGGVTATFPEDRNNVGPRVSAAWSPSRKAGARMFTLHVGYGAFYGRVPGATVRAALTDSALPQTTTHIRITPTTETQCPQVTTASQSFGYPCAYTTAPPAAVAQTSSATVFSSRFRMPAVQRASLELERGFGRLSVRAGYSMALATQLPQSVDLNLAPSTELGSFVLQGGNGRVGVRDGETFLVPLYTARLISQYGPVTALVSHANATYNAGTIEAHWRGRGFEAHGGYTFSKALDYGPQGSAIPRLNGQFDPVVDGYDKGTSTLNLPQRFSGELQYASGLKRGIALRGWKLAAIGVAGSGAPYSYGIFGGTRLSGGHESINGSGGATYLPTIGRNTLRLPPRGRVDLRVGREFGFGARVRVEAFAEAFNLMNARSLSRVETRAFLVGTPATAGAPTPLVFQDAATVATEGVNTPAFGAPTSSTTGLSRERQLEIGARLHF
jgi:hypothetical protein